MHSLRFSRFTMFRGKYNLYAWTTNLLAFYGITGFYFDTRSERVTKTRFLCCYSWLISVIVFGTGPIIIYEYLNTVLKILSVSRLAMFCTRVFPIILTSMTMSCVYCTRRWQHRIFKIIVNLLKMENRGISHYYWKQRVYLIRLLWIRLVLNVVQYLLYSTLTAIAEEGVIYKIHNLFSKCVVCGVHSLHFTLICKICDTFLITQARLEHLLQHPLPMPIQFHKIIRIQKICHRLIRMIAEICSIFEFPLFTTILYLVNLSCFNGYFIIRYFFAEPLMYSPIRIIVIILCINIIELSQFYGLFKICELTENLLQSTLHILRNPVRNVDIVERSIDWFGLQLSWQNTRIHIFGICTMNPNLAFIIIINVILHILYMAQSDYNFLK